MKNFFSLCFLLVMIVSLTNCGNEASKEVKTVTKPEKRIQPEDTLDLLAENFVDNATQDTIEAETEVFAEESIAQPVKETNPASLSKATEKRKKKRSRKKPKVSFETEKYSFGRIMQGEEKEFKFKFKNTGNADLQIINVTATCGCTTPSYPFIPIEPGEEGYIGVTYNSTGKLGAQKPSITVVTNASPKTYKLYLEGTVDAQRED